MKIVHCYGLGVAVGKKSIRLYEGNPINLQYPLLQCFGRTQGIVIVNDLRCAQNDLKPGSAIESACLYTMILASIINIINSVFKDMYINTCYIHPHIYRTYDTSLSLYIYIHKCF